MCHVFRGYEIGNLSIRIASNILQSGRAFRFLVQTLDRHDGEYLVNCPRVGKRLEQGEVTEIFIRQQLGQAPEFIRRMFQATSYLVYFAGDGPIKAFNLGTSLQIDYTVTE